MKNASLVLVFFFLAPLIAYSQEGRKMFHVKHFGAVAGSTEKRYEKIENIIIYVRVGKTCKLILEIINALRYTVSR